MSDYNEKILSRVNTSLNDIQWKDTLNIYNNVKFYTSNAVSSVFKIINGNYSDARIAIYNDLVLHFYAHVVNLKNISTSTSNYTQIITVTPGYISGITFITRDELNNAWIKVISDGRILVAGNVSNNELYFNLHYIISK